MKKLFFLWSLLLTSLGAMAQTDVTSQYLVNAGFDDASSFVSATIYTYANDATANGGVSSCQAVAGWIADGTGDAKAGGAMQFGCGYGLSGTNYICPESDSEGNTSGGVLALAGCWGNSAGYSQDLTLLAGLYRISYRLYNAGANIIGNYTNTIGFVESGGSTHYADMEFYTAEWTEGVIYLSLAQETSGTMHVGYTCANVGSGASPKIFLDYIKIEAYNAAQNYSLVDKTSLVGTAKSDWGCSNNNYTAEGVSASEKFQWAASLATGEQNSQTVSSLPNGTYQVSAYVGVSSTSGRDNTSNVLTEYATNYVSFHANSVSHGVPAYNRTDISKFDRIELNDVSVTDGTLKLYLNEDVSGPNWLTAQIKKLLYLNTNDAVAVNYGAFPLPTTAVTAGYWYQVAVPVAGDYTLTPGTSATLSYTQDGTALTSGTFSTTTGGTVTLSAGTLYVKSSAATTITLAATSYGYNVGEATADRTYVQAGQTVTVTYADANTNNPSASLSVSTSGIRFGGNTVTATATANGFTFTVPTVTAGTDYTLSIPANAVGYAAGSTYNSAQTITFHTPAILDQTAYIYSPKAEKFMSRGNAYGTAAIVDNYGIPVKIATNGDGQTTIQFVDNNLYLYNVDWAYADGDSPMLYSVAAASTSNYSGYKLTSTSGLVYLNGERMANNGVKGDNFSDDDYTIWQVKTRAERDAAKTAKTLADHVAIAAAAGETITTESGFTSFISSFKDSENLTSSVAGADLTGSLNSAWAATNVRNTNGAYAINSNGTEFYQSVETFTQTVTGLDEGVYKVTLNGYFREGSNANCVTYADYDLSTAYLQANDYQTNLATWASDRTADDAPNGQGAAKTLFDAGKYLNTLYTYVGSDGQLTITISNPNYLNYGWVNFCNLTLTHYFNETLDEAYAKLATALEDCAPWSGTYSVYTSTQTAYNNRTYTTVAEIHAAITALQEAYKTYCATNYDNEHPYDTGLIKNPSYDSGTDNWATALNQSGGGSMGVVSEGGDNIYKSTYNTYMRHSTVYQEGITVPAGTYKLSAQMKGSPKDDESTFIYATDGSVAHWESPVFKGNTWYGYLTTDAASDWTEVYTFITLTETTTLRIGVLSWGNNYSGGTGGAYSVDDWKLEQVKYATEILGEYYVGDVDGDSKVTVKDVPVLVKALLENKTSELPSGANANQAGGITVDDVNALAEIIAAGEQTLVQDAPVKYTALVYTEQLNSENQAGDTYQMKSAVNVDPSEVTSISEALTTLNINVSGISNIKSVSVYAKGKEKITGYLTYNTQTGSFTVSNGDAPSSYGKSMASDVVSVYNDNNATSFKAYLLPTALSNGVTVTVRTTSDVYYKQDFSVTANTTNTLTFNNTTATGTWMATVPGDIHFNYLSIPGAHDAATSSCSSAWAKCQSKDISALLNAGVRSLDLRPNGSSSSTAENLTIYHGITSTGVLFKTALANVVSYLTSNPTETVFIIIHDESGNTTSAWQNAVLACLQNVSDYVKVIDSNMTLDDCRGKMVVLSRDNVGASSLLGKCGWGSSYNAKTVFYGTDTNSTTPWTVYYQDNYSTTNTSTHLGEVETLLSDYLANNELNQNYLYFNTTNIAGTATYPTSYAKAMNQGVVNSSVFNSHNGRFGIISSDFIADSTYAGDVLLQFIIDQNYKYVYKGRTRNN